MNPPIKHNLNMSNICFIDVKHLYTLSKRAEFVEQALDLIEKTDDYPDQAKYRMIL